MVWSGLEVEHECNGWETSNLKWWNMTWSWKLCMQWTLLATSGVKVWKSYDILKLLTKWYWAYGTALYWPIYLTLRLTQNDTLARKLHFFNISFIWTLDSCLFQRSISSEWDALTDEQGRGATDKRCYVVRRVYQSDMMVTGWVIPRKEHRGRRVRAFK